MAVAETAKSGGKVSGAARPRRQSKSKTPTCRKARSALFVGDMWLQANQNQGYSLPCVQSQYSSALSRSSSERYAPSQAGGTANLGAGGNIALVEGRTTKSEDLNWLETRKDLTSSTTKRTSSTSDQSTAITTTISGNNGVNLQSQGGTLLLSGANVSSQNGNVALTGAEVIIASTQNGQNNSRTIDEKKTGASLSDLAGIATFGVVAPIANAGKGINAQSKEGAMAGDTSLVQTTVTGQNVQVTSTGTGTNASVGGNISLKAAALNATGTGSAAGRVNLDAGTNQ